MAKKPSKDSYKVKSVFIDTKPTTYNTQFRPSALQQVADKINADGLPLLLVHDSNSLPVGAWYEAQVDNDNQVVGKFFVPKEVGEYNDIKTRIDTGILDSVSIGFSADVHDCSICGNDIQNYEDCPHIPGKDYEAKDPVSGASLGTKTCYVMLDGVHAKEGSLVYAGAVPNAKVIESSDKAEFFTKNEFNFAEGKLEVVHGGAFMQDSNEQENNGSSQMDEKFIELSGKYNDLREENIALKTEALDNKVKVDGYADLETKVEEANAATKSVADKFSATVATIGEAVSKLAAPFNASYEAPTDVDQLLADLDTYMAKAKALPTGRQSQENADDVTYVTPISAYEV